MIQRAIAARRQAQAEADAAQAASDMEVRRQQERARATYTKEALAVSNLDLLPVFAPSCTFSSSLRSAYICPVLSHPVPPLAFGMPNHRLQI